MQCSIQNIWGGAFSISLLHPAHWAWLPAGTLVAFLQSTQLGPLEAGILPQGSRPDIKWPVISKQCF